MTPSRHLAGLALLVSSSVLTVLLAALLWAAVPRSAVAQSGSPPQLATLVADTLYLDGPGTLIAEGNVEALFRGARLQASRIRYDRASDQVFVEGPITLSEGPDVVILADQAELSLTLRQGLIRSARVVLDQQLQIAAHSVELVDDRFVVLNAAIASSCEICANRRTPLWEIRARRVVQDEAEQQVYFEHAQFRLFGLPVFYVPRLRVPDPRLDRATGFLTPSFVIDTNHGFGLRAPYFIVLSQDRDLTLTPFVGSQGTRALEVRYRQAFAAGRLELGGLVARDSIRRGRTRAIGNIAGAFALGRGYELDFNIVQPSDRSVLEDYRDGDPLLTSNVTLQRIQRDVRLRVEVLQFRSLRLADVGAALPNTVGQAVIERRRDLPGLGGVGSLRLEAHLHQRRTGLAAALDPAPGIAVGPLPRELGRLSLDLDWRRDAVLPGGVQGAVGLNLGIDRFRLSDTGGVFPTSATRVTPNAMAELRWPLVRRETSGVTHVIEPVAQVIWGRDRQEVLPHEANRMPELDPGNLFSLDRFPARDTREAGLRGNLGLSWTRQDTDGWSSTLMLGRVWRQRDLGQFSQASPLSGTSSDWLLEARLDTGAGLSIANRSLLSPDMRLQRTALELDWTGEDFAVSTSVLHITGNTFESRARTSTEWNFAGQRALDDYWTARVGWRYDVAQSRAAQAQLGLEYENECLRMAVGLERQFATASSPTPRTSFGLKIDILGIGGNPGRARRACSEL